MPPPSPQDAPQPANYAAIAKAAGLSKSAVSYAMRGLPGVSETTRQRVLQVAQELGYRPDPRLGVLNHRRWNQNRQYAGERIAIVQCATLVNHAFFAPYRGKIQEECQRRGYQVETFTINESQRTDYARILRDRGIQGVILSSSIHKPFIDHKALEDLAVIECTTFLRDWHRFSAVLPDVPGNMMDLIERLRKHPKPRRIGFLTFTDTGLYLDLLREAAIGLGMRALADRLCDEPVLYIEDQELEPITAWTDRQQPDCIIGINDAFHWRLLEIGWDHRTDPERISIALEMPGGTGPFAGYTRPVDIFASRTVDLLCRLLDQQQFGLPLSRETLLLESRWSPGDRNLLADPPE